MRGPKKRPRSGDGRRRGPGDRPDSTASNHGCQLDERALRATATWRELTLSLCDPLGLALFQPESDGVLSCPRCGAHSAWELSRDEIACAACNCRSTRTSIVVQVASTPGAVGRLRKIRAGEALGVGSFPSSYARGERTIPRHGGHRDADHLRGGDEDEGGVR